MERPGSYNHSVEDKPAATIADVYYGDRRACAQHGLALEAVGIAYAIQERPGGFAVVVAGADAERARRELEEYDDEDPVEAPAQAAVEHGNGWIGVAGFAIVLAVFTALQMNHVFTRDWDGPGSLNSGLVRGGEVWRTVTALTLHQDLSHLVSNIVIGGLIGLFVGQVLGSGLAWMSILLAGAAGNLLSASFRQSGFTASGASTAVFAALGILAGFEWTRRRQLRTSMLVRYAPVVGGVVLLSLLGTGGERTDVISHVMGFLCGMLLGGVYGKFGIESRFGRGAQIGLGVGAVALLVMSWMFALARMQ